MVARCCMITTRRKQGKADRASQLTNAFCRRDAWPCRNTWRRMALSSCSPGKPSLNCSGVHVLSAPSRARVASSRSRATRALPPSIRPAWRVAQRECTAPTVIRQKRPVWITWGFVQLAPPPRARPRGLGAHTVWADGFTPGSSRRPFTCLSSRPLSLELLWPSNRRTR